MLHAKSRIGTIFVILISLIFSVLYSQDRFPRPEFDSDYSKPITQVLPPDSFFIEIVDVAVLIIALGLAVFFVIRKRSRNSIYMLSLFSLLYFGFWRKGCICPIGSTQNIVQALVDPMYFIPLSAVLIFALPLITALFFGRAFCAAVCPMGAAQELMLYKPLKLPQWITVPLSLIPYIFLGLTVLYTATGSGYITCQLDPFVAFFRFGGELNMIIFGLFFLVLGIFVGRPYCRFLCPYGVLLGWMSKFSKWHLTITPDHCTQCRLCEESCPYDAINIPVDPVTPGEKRQAGKRIFILTAITAGFVFIGAVIGSFSHVYLSKLNPVIKLSEQVMAEQADPSIDNTLASRTFHGSDKPLTDLLTEADDLRNQFQIGGILLGIFIGLVIGLKTIGVFFKYGGKDYEADRTDCFSCGRCMPYCPDEHERQKILESNKRLYESIG